jgi:hypothetical protein
MGFLTFILVLFESAVDEYLQGLSCGKGEGKSLLSCGVRTSRAELKARIQQSQMAQEETSGPDMSQTAANREIKGLGETFLWLRKIRKEKGNKYFMEF